MPHRGGQRYVESVTLTLTFWPKHGIATCSCHRNLVY